VPIYLGRNSCYARHGLRPCPRRGRKGVDTKDEVDCIIRKIVSELRRGYTFDQSCRKIRMSKKLAKRRLLFLVKLACMHGSKKICEYAKKKVEKTIKRWKL